VVPTVAAFCHRSRGGGWLLDLCVSSLRIQSHNDEQTQRAPCPLFAVCYRRGSNIEETGAHWWAISSLPVRSNRPPAAPRLCKEARAVEVVTRRWASELTEDPRRSYGAAPVPPVPRRGQGWAAELLLVWPSCPAGTNSCALGYASRRRPSAAFEMNPHIRRIRGAMKIDLG